MTRIFRRLFGNIKLTFAISVMTIGSIAIAILAVSLGLFISLTGSVQEDANKEVAGTMRITAAILAVNLPSLNVLPDDAGNVSGLQIRRMPRLRTNDVIDAIGRTTGEQAVIYVHDPEAGPDFTVSTTTLVGADGERLMDAPIVEGTPLYAALMKNTAVRETATINNVAYFLDYQPIVKADGTVAGALQIAVARAPIEAVVGKTLTMLAYVGGAALLVIGLLALVLSRLLTRPIPKLSKVMSAIASGELDTEVPYIDGKNEVGDMARAIEVFRDNGVRVAGLSGEEQARQARAQSDRSAMMGSLLAAFGQVVDAAVAGDFSQRVMADFPDDELNLLASSVNNLVTTVEDGLSETQTVLSALADTNLSVRMKGNYQGAFAALRDSTNKVGEQLTDIVGQLRQTSRSLKTATGEILAGANDLSERTTRQAATIEETSAAVEQLAGTVSGNAQKAVAASGKADSVSRSAEEGGEVMARATDAMERITQSSSKISNIIGLIDDIAFQTNLLALNASVEAARAGDAGKGFAVVAVEVRRLAQSAAGASSEIKGLIDTSVQEVAGGSKLVADAADKLSAMLGAVRENNALLEDIAAASQEQASAIDEVAQAVRVMDEMTQHNAALVEETNAAIEQTEAQASELDRIVDVFTLDAIPASAERSSSSRQAA